MKEKEKAFHLDATLSPLESFGDAMNSVKDKYQLEKEIKLFQNMR